MTVWVPILFEAQPIILKLTDVNSHVDYNESKR
jgi:hypothetical protein